jgi:hypothetical protein
VPVPDSEYYAQQAKLLFAMAAATSDPDQAARIASRAQEYMNLAHAAADDASSASAQATAGRALPDNDGQS